MNQDSLLLELIGEIISDKSYFRNTIIYLDNIDINYDIEVVFESW